MAVYKRDMVDINLETGNIHRSFLSHAIGMKDQLADHFGIRVYRNGEPVNLTGVSVQGVFMPPQGDPIAITSGNIVSGNEAEVVLPQACYNYDGQFTLAIKLVDSTNSVTGTIRIVDGMVDNTHASGTVAPTSAVPSYQEVLAAYEQAIAVIGYSVRFDQTQSLTDTQKGTARGNIGAASASDLTAEATARANADTAEATARANADTKFENILSAVNASGLLPMSSLFPKTESYLTFTEAGNGYIHISGTQNGRALVNFIDISGDDIPDYFAGAKDAIIYIGYRNRTTNYMIPVDLYVKTVSNPSSHVLKDNITMSQMVSLPSDLTAITLRVDIPESAGVVLNDDMTICLLKGRYPNLQKSEDWLFAGSETSLSETNLNNVYTVGFYLLTSDKSYTNKPTGYTQNTGYMAVIRSSGYWMQMFFEFSGNRIWKRRSTSTEGSWEDWQFINDLSGTIVCEPSGLATLDLNSVHGNHFYLMTDSHEYVNKPTTSNTGFLMVADCGASFTIQIYYQFTGGKIFKRRGLANGSSWEDWQEISGIGGGTVIENTYNITTSPQITTDTNGWLQAVDTDTSSETGKTDMTGPIMSMLNDTGYCHLGEGIFYVSGSIDMPAHSTLCGCGDKTQIRLLQTTTTGYCVKLTDYSTIKDVSFSGSYSAITPTTEGTRDGVHFVGGYESTPQKRCSHCVIDNVIFRNFSGAGLLCDETSLSPEHGLYATNLYFTNCYAGIYIRRYSEFHKFTNICTTDCYYGVINNGGNNVFTACTFRATNTAFYIDGTAPNSAHGTINGCTFCHTGSNAGSAITMEDVTAGFVVSSCQFWYNSVDLSNCKGIAFSGCEFGNGITGSGKVIEISGGDTIMFTGCIFKDDPVITISNNSKVKFTGCFERDSGNEVTGQ